MKTKSVGGKEYPASDFAYVGDPQDISTWSLPIFDEGHVRDAMARFDQTQMPSGAKAGAMKKIMARAKSMGIDASGFADAHKSMMADMSFDDVEQEIYEALDAKFGRDGSGYPKYSMVETFPSYAIVRDQEGCLYQVSYSIGPDGEATLGDPQEVETAYVPVQESARFMEAAAGQGDEWSYPIEIMRPGLANGAVEGSEKLPQYFPPAVVAQVAAAVAEKSIPFGRRHLLPGEHESTATDRVAGWVDSGRLSGETAVGVAHLLESEKDLQAKLQAARAAGKLGELFGTSVLGYFAFKVGQVNGQKVLEATRLAKLASIDLCVEPATGSRFITPTKVAAAVAELQRSAVKTSASRGAANHGSAEGAGRNQGAAMKERILKVLEALRKVDAGRAEELKKEFDGCKEEQLNDLFVKVAEAATSIAPAQGAAAATEAANAAAEAARTALAETRKLRSENAITAKVTAAKLPEKAAEHVRTTLANLLAAKGELDDASIDAEIARTREAFAAFVEVGKVAKRGIVIGLDSADKAQLAVDLMLGVKLAEADKGKVQAFRGLRQAYTEITGDYDLTRLSAGGFSGHVLKASEAIATADFPNILLNSMTKRLLQDYAEVGMNGVDRLFTSGPPLGDYKTQDRVREGYLGDLPTVAEAAAYTELTKPTDEKISYAPGKFGGLLTISEETIRNDDLGKIAQFPSRLARAARRTLKQFVTNFFINNPNYDVDTVAWFHAGHTNLGSVALSAAELTAREIALAKQSEKDSSKRLGLPLDWIMVPVDLYATAVAINQNDEGANVWFHRFGVNNEGIIKNELLTDTNDWYYGTDQANAPFLEIGFLDGYQTPQIFLANLPTQGTLFTNDQIQYKVKFVFGGDIIDFRGVGKNVVA